MARKASTIDQYLAALPAAQRAALQKVRKTIRTASPRADECISYGLPAFRLDGRVLVALGATPSHCAFYPMSATTVAANRDALARYQTSKGAIRFQPNRSLPAALVRKLVKDRMAENARKGSSSFPADVVRLFQDAKILGVRAGTHQRYTAVWVIVAEGRVFVRSWNDKPAGWYRAFRKEPRGRVRVAGREIDVRARPTRSQRLQAAVSDAYGDKYDTNASRKWVRGFRAPKRQLTTLELVRA